MLNKYLLNAVEFNQYFNLPYARYWEPNWHTRQTLPASGFSLIGETDTNQIMAEITRNP